MTFTLHSRGEHERGLILWHLFALVLVALAPTMARDGLPFWRLPAGLVSQVPTLLIGYLGSSVVLGHAVRRPSGLPIWAGVPAAALAFGLPVLVLLELQDASYSRAVVLLGVGLGTGLAVAPYLVPASLFRPLLVTLGLVSLATIPWAFSVTAGSDAREDPSLRATSLHNLRITQYSGLVPRAPTTGGGLDLFGDGLIVTNGVGEMRRLTWNGESLQSAELDIPPLLKREDFLADNPVASELGYFRIMDLLVDTVSTPQRLLVSHYHWDRKQRCAAIRLSAIVIDETGNRAPDAAWRTLFTADPCIPWDGAVSDFTNHSGGRIAWAFGDTLLFSVGDMRQQGRQGSRPLSQQEDADYGKILTMTLDGTAAVWSLGHRNPQGLTVARDGTVWSTEHGPRGGDELNRVVRGGNYGWPYATYGTSNDSNFWPLADGRRDHGPYVEPMYAWVPSVGISQVIEVVGTQLSSWEGDLLVASMAGQSLYRLRIRADRAVYAEQIPLGRRLRDLVEDPQGRLILWTDEADVIAIVNAGNERSGEVVFAQCAVCHEAGPNVPSAGPSLRGVLGRRAASQPDYPYSPALSALDLRWTSTSLDQFLWNPGRFAPGTTMAMDGLSDADREAVIEYLESFR